MTMLEPILIVGVVIAATAWYVQHKWRKRMRALARVRDTREGTVLELLGRRYARGEIDATTFEQMRERLQATTGPRQQ